MAGPPVGTGFLRVGEYSKNSAKMTATPHLPHLLLAAAGLLAGCQPAGSAMDSDSRLAIEAAVSRYVAASNQGDAEALTSLYTEDAVLLPPDHGPIQGREAIGEFWRRGTDSGLVVRTMRVEVEGSMGYLVGQYRLPPTSEEPADSGKYVMCLRRQRDGSWKLSADIWNSSAGEADSEEEETTGPVPSVT